MISPSADVPAAGRKRALEVILGVVLLAILAGYVFASQLRFLDNDEYEHLHKAWMMTQGTIPYLQENNPFLMLFVLGFFFPELNLYRWS